jgi:hypothetical protein
VSNERGWIQLAEENGGMMEVSTISDTPCRYSVSVKFPDGERIWGPIRNTLQDAIDGLNERLGQDAANEFLGVSGL